MAILEKMEHKWGGYYSTNPNETMKDNYSTTGNTNPHTGQEGTIEPTR